VASGSFRVRGFVQQVKDTLSNVGGFGGVVQNPLSNGGGFGFVSVAWVR